MIFNPIDFYNNPILLNELEINGQDPREGEGSNDYTQDDDTTANDDTTTDDAPATEEDAGNNTTDYTQEEEPEDDDVNNLQDDTDEDEAPEEDTGDENTTTDYTQEEEPADDTADEGETNDIATDTGGTTTDYTAEDPDGGSDDNATDDDVEGSDETETGEDTDNVDSNDDGDDDSDSATSLEDSEKDLFKDLSPHQMVIKNTELLRNYIDLYDTIIIIINDVEKIEKTSENIEQLDFVNEKLVELKDIINYTISKTYITRTYVENLTHYKQSLLLLSQINLILKQLIQKTKAE